MKLSRIFINLIIVLALMAVMLPAPQAVQAQAMTPPEGEITRDTQYIPGQIVIAFEQGKSSKTYSAQAKALAGSVGAMVADSYSNVALLEVDPQADIEALAQQIVSTGQALAAVPNYVYWMPEETDTVLGDPLVSNGYSITSQNGQVEELSWDETASLQRLVKVNGKYRSYSTFPKELFSGRLWGWDAVEADLIWTNSSSGVPYVAVLDTGVDYNNKDLSGRVSNGYDFFNDDSRSYDDNGHGTHVAGIIVAKTNYNYKTDESTAGVSNGKVLSVKVLGAQGYGTSYSLAAGIIYAASKSYVKVINLSLGSTVPDRIVYLALTYAVNNMNKLVVAAAGNESSSDPVYPAAWADNTVTGGDGYPNTLNIGLIAVAAARSARADGTPLWVDQNGDGKIDDGETFAAQDCASAYTNYGSWVSIVAPGDNIYSTTPTSYPFYLNYYGSVTPGYDTLSGSSMASAFVSGAAARVWGKGILSSDELLSANKFVKLRLTLEGKTLNFASDGGLETENITYGYDNNLPSSPSARYGDILDTTGSLFPSGSVGEGDPGQVIPAPYCWPNQSGNFEEAQNMTGTVYLNVADAMDRGALWAEVKDAATGEPLAYSAVAAYDSSTVAGRLYRRGYAKTVSSGSQIVMINLPIYNDSTTYDLRVAKSGYTSGYQIFNDNLILNETNDGQIIVDNYSSVSLAPSSNIQAVLDWQNSISADSGYEEPNLDMYLWIPDDPGNTADGGIIGPNAGRLEDVFPDMVNYGYDFLGAGSILDTSKFLVPGSTESVQVPYAQHMFDGGQALGMDGEGNWMAPTELITIKRNSSLSAFPYATLKYSGIYTLMVTDYNDGVDTTDEPHYLTKDNPDIDTSDFFIAPIVRIWANGKIISTVKIENADNTCSGGDTASWWEVATLSSSGPTLVNTCHDSSYSIAP